MQNDKLYQFLTTKCKENGVAIEGLPSQFGFSRSTLYRHMKGMIKMSAEVQETFSALLSLNEAEMQEFSNLINETTLDSNLIAARAVLDDFVFEHKNKPNTPENIRFAFYDNDTFLRTSDELYDTVLALLSSGKVTCEVSAINCLTPKLSTSVMGFLEKLLEKSNSVKVEHLLTYSPSNPLHNTMTLIDILPLLSYEGYTAFYNKAEINAENFALLEHTVLISVKSEEIQKYFFLSFTDDMLSSCLSTSDKNVYAFFMDNYKTYKKNFSSALNTVGLGVLSDQIAQLQESSNCYIIKSDFCYDRIPISAYNHLFARISPEEMATLQGGIGSADSLGNQTLEDAVSVIADRISSSFLNKHIDVYSVGGLTNFAKTGRITEHFAFMPSFDNEERKMILEYIKGRYVDENDDYTLYITQKPILEQGYILLAFENSGLIVEYNKSQYAIGRFHSLYIKNELLAEPIIDYIKYQIPEKHAISREETIAFLDRLISEL